MSESNAMRELVRGEFERLNDNAQVLAEYPELHDKSSQFSMETARQLRSIPEGTRGRLRLAASVAESRLRREGRWKGEERVPAGGSPGGEPRGAEGDGEATAEQADVAHQIIGGDRGAAVDAYKARAKGGVNVSLGGSLARVLGKALAVLLLCAVLAPAQWIIIPPRRRFPPPVPTPDFVITADSDSVDYDGDGSSGPCTVTTAVLEEHPAMSGLYAVDFDGSSGTVTCGTALDQLHTGTIVAFVDHDAFGENGVGQILSKSAGGLSADSAWRFNVNDTNDRMQLAYFNNGGGSRSLVSPTDSADPFADYTCVAISWTVSTLASLAGQHYIAGAPVTTSQIDAGGGDAADDDASHTVTVGNILGDNATFNGHIGFPLRVWRSVLSDAQVAAACAQGRS